MRQQLDISEPRGLPTPGTLSDMTHLLFVNGGSYKAFLSNFFGLVRVFEKRIKSDFGGKFWIYENTLDYINLSKYINSKFGGDTVLEKCEVVFKEIRRGEH